MAISINKFKEAHGAIDVINNPKTGKQFFVAEDGTQGAVSSKLDKTGEMVFSQLTNETTGEVFWCLSNKLADNVVFTL
jgi:hypothetical protein